MSSVSVARRGRTVCKKLDAAFLEALAEAIDDRLLARAVTKAVERLRRRHTNGDDERSALMRERDRTAASIRNRFRGVWR